MNEEIKLEGLNRSEALRYLGYGDNQPQEQVMNLIAECEAQIVKAAKPRYVYKVFDIVDTVDGIALSGTNLVLPGDSVKEHLTGCERAVILAVTVSSEVDRLIRAAQVNNMARAVILDSLGSVAAEQACEKTEAIIRKAFPNDYQTWRFGIGYGDLPLSLQPEVLNILNAGRQIGLSVNNSFLMSPAKSVTAVIGLSKNKIPQSKRGCQTCDLREKCIYRKEGGHCNV